MTTIVKSVKSPNRTMTIEPSRYSDSTIFIWMDGSTVGAHIDAADIIKAVEAECDVRLVPSDAIVILRDELPEVTEHVPCGPCVEIPVRGHLKADRATAWAEARASVALALYLDAHPPVDEAQVEALTGLLIDADMDHPDGPVPSLVARRLYLAGVRIEPTEKEN